MKALLIQTTGSWDDFIKRAENVAWIAFPDASLNRVEKDKTAGSWDDNKKKWCVWHETASMIPKIAYI